MPTTTSWRDSVLKRLLSEQDKGESPKETQVISAVLRRKGSLQERWHQFVKQPQKLPQSIALILTLGTYEFLLAASAAPHAVVHEWVERAKKFSGGAHASLVNAVLRRVSEMKSSPLEPQKDFQAWVWEQWEREVDKGTLQQRAEALVEQPLFICGSDEAPITTDNLSAYLEECEAKKISPRVQSFSSRYAVQLLNWMKTHYQPRTFLDLCTGKGGKLFPFLETHSSPWDRVVACDSSEFQKQLFQEGLTRKPPAVRDKVQFLSPIELKKDSKKFDLILLDAPCTGSGAWGKHPLGKWRVTAEVLKKMVMEQEALLQFAAGKLMPGGMLLYAVCSVFHDEGEGHARDQTHQSVILPTTFLKTHGANFHETASGGISIEPGKGFEGFYLRALTLQ